MLGGGFDENVSGYPLYTCLSMSLMTDSVRHANERHWDYTLFKGLHQTRGNVWNRWRFVKKLFMFLEELNRRIRENGLNFRLPWICIFKNISRLPSHFAFFLDFSHLFSDSDNFFRDPWVPLTFFRAATFAVNHFPIKIREKNVVLTQHSAKAHGFFAKRFPEIRTSEPVVAG